MCFELELALFVSRGPKADELHVKFECRRGGNPLARPLLPVSIFGRKDEQRTLTHPHGGKPAVPPTDYLALAERELEGLVPITGRIKDRALE